MKLGIAIFVICIAGYACAQIAKQNETEEMVQVSVISILSMLVILPVTGLLAGWGGWFPQAKDWLKHNAVLKDLVELAWPVYYNNANTPSMLTYYIGQYIVPALCGKITSSFRIAECMVFVWGEIGLILIILHLFVVCRATNLKKQISLILILIFFNGCLILSKTLFDIGPRNADVYVEEMNSIQWMTSIKGILLQYRSNFVNLRWVMPQCISIWLIISIWYKFPEKVEIFVPLMLPALLNGSISFLGLVMMAVICLIAFIFLNGNVKILRRTISLPNILSAIFIGIPLLIYFWGNVFSEKEAAAGFSLQPFSFWLYFCFVLGEFGLYAIFIWKNHSRNPIFISAVVLLLVLPFFKIGVWNDLVMSASIPGMFVIMICLVEFLFLAPKTFRAGVLITILCISSLYPLQEITRIIQKNQIGELDHLVQVETLEEYSDLNSTEIEWKYNYYSYDVDSNYFIRYLARRPWGKN